MNSKIILGIALGYAIGFLCSVLAIPVPAPPVLVGALLVVAMTSGYLLTDRYLAKHRPYSQTDHCGGPTGKQKHD